MTPARADNGMACMPAPLAIFEVARAHPRAIAIEDDDERVDYGTLAGRALSTASGLRERGVTAGSLVAVCLPRSADQIIATLAAWCIGAAYMPLDPSWPEARLSGLIADADCAALIAEPDLGPRIARHVTLARVSRLAADLDEAVVRVTPDALAYVIYTSGSSGAPKAVEVEHRNLAALIAWHHETFAVSSDTRTSHLAGLGFDAAAWEVWPTLAAGATLCLVDAATRIDAAALRDWLVERRVEVAFAPTALAEPMVGMPWPTTTALRVLLTGAERLKVRPKTSMPFALVNNYGPTESSVVATSGTVDPAGSGLPSIGRPISGTRIHLLGADGAAVPPGHEGEICIAGAQVARGYRGDDQLTARKFVIHPEFGRLYRTGDLGAWLPSGELDFRGRIDEQVKVRGHRVEPAEVAAALNQLDGIDTSAVVIRDGQLVAYVVPADGAAVFAEELRFLLGESLPDYMVPTRFASLQALPLTGNGKIDAAAFPDPATSPVAEKSAVTRRSPETPTEQRLLDILGEVLGHSDIGIDDDFFLLGGHSLLGTQLVIRARQAFGVELTLFHLFERRTVARLAEIIETLVAELIDGMSDEDVRRMAAR